MKHLGLVTSLLLAIGTVLFHIIHCLLPILLPILIIFGWSVPHIFHQFTVPWPLTVLSAFWLAYYWMLRKRIIVFLQKSHSK